MLSNFDSNVKNPSNRKKNLNSIEQFQHHKIKASKIQNETT